MKTKIRYGFVLLLSVLTMTQTAYALPDSTALTKAVLPDSAKVTVNKVYEDVKQGIAGLGSALKVGATHVYEVLVRQQIIYSICYITCFVISLIMLLSFFKRLKDTKEDWLNNVGDPTLLGVCRIIQGVIGALLFVAFLFNIINTLTGFINPEYGAIKDIISFVKKE